MSKKMIRVRLLFGQSGPEGVQPSGTVVSMDDETAKRFIDMGRGEYVKEKAPTKKDAPKTDPKLRTKRTSTKQKTSTKR